MGQVCSSDIGTTGRSSYARLVAYPASNNAAGVVATCVPLPNVQRGDLNVQSQTAYSETHATPQVECDLAVHEQVYHPGREWKAFGTTNSWTSAAGRGGNRVSE